MGSGGGLMSPVRAGTLQAGSNKYRERRLFLLPILFFLTLLTGLVIHLVSFHIHHNQNSQATNALSEIDQQFPQALTVWDESPGTGTPSLGLPVEAEQTRFMRVQLNNGRMNNQLRSLDGAIRVAAALGRTLLVENSCLRIVNASDGLERMVKCKNQWLGLDEGLWDLSEVRKKFSFLLEEDVVRSWGSLDNHPVLGKPPNSGCSIGVEGILKKASRLSHCALLYVHCGGVFPWIESTTEQYGIPRTSFLQAIKPGEYIRKAARQYAARVRSGRESGGSALEDGGSLVTVHLRTFQESIRYQTKDEQERMKRAKKHCSEVIGRQTKNMPANPKDDLMFEFCNLTDVSINLALKNGRLPPLDKTRPWFFAGSDELDGSVLARTLRSLGGVKFDYKDFLNKHTSEGGSRQHTIQDPYLKNSCRLNEMALLDMWIMVGGDFFVGNPSSTFSQMVCLVRGPERAGSSNMCVWQLQKYKVLSEDYVPPELPQRTTIPGTAAVPQTVSSFKGATGKPTSTVTASWVWSNDKQFVLLDTYVTPTTGGHHLVFLGDGRLPIHFLSPEAYTHDLRCTLPGGGGEVEAQVMLMSGGKVTERGYLYDDPIPGYQPLHRPLSTGPNMHTTMITCPLPTQNGQWKEVTLHNRNNSFILRPSSTPVPPPSPISPPPDARFSAVHCLCPVYDTGVSGFKQRDPRLLVEWLEYHRAMGFAHVHIYMQAYEDKISRKVLEYYKRIGFITEHDWTAGSSQGITYHTYQKAKYLAMGDCFLRTRGAADFMVVGDIDEILISPKPLQEVLTWMHSKFSFSHGKHHAFSFSSKTLLPFLTEQQRASGSQSLLLELLDTVEKKCTAPFNCGEFHRGRQKYFLRMRETDLPLFVPWTHAVSRNYTLSSQVHVQMGEDMIHLRHLSGQWFKDGLPEKDTLHWPLGTAHLQIMRESIPAVGVVREIYGADAIKPMASTASPTSQQTSQLTSEYKQAASGPFVCSAELAQSQAKLFFEALKRNGRFSSCPAASWLQELPKVWNPHQLTLVDIGCNKGYTSAKMFSTFTPRLNMNVQLIHQTVRKVLGDSGSPYSGGACGVCGDCRERGGTRSSSTSTWPVPVVHCVEPSPSTFKLLEETKEHLVTSAPELKSQWRLHNLGMAEKARPLVFDGPSDIKENAACRTAGQETCGMVDYPASSSPSAIIVNGSSVSSFFTQQHIASVDILKIDAEGFDPMVLEGAYSVLGGQAVKVLMFEYHGLQRWKTTDLSMVVEKLDGLGWDCYLDGNPDMVRLTRCWVPELEFKWWSNVVCFKRDQSSLADVILNKFATFLHPALPLSQPKIQSQTPQKAPSAQVPHKPYSHETSGPFQCSPELASKQAGAFERTLRSAGLYFACPKNNWLELLPRLWTPRPLTLVDIGCNKGYTSINFFSAFAPEFNLNPQMLGKYLSATLDGSKMYGGTCGVCGDCREAPLSPGPKKWPPPTVHCIEPSPSTFVALQGTKSFLSKSNPQLESHWLLHNLGMADVKKTLVFDGPPNERHACRTPGMETCGIVSSDTQSKTAIRVNGSSVSAFVSENHLSKVDILKIDAEGFDPLVLDGAYSFLSGDAVKVLLFEYHKLGYWQQTQLKMVVEKLDGFGWDCYLDGSPVLVRLTRCWVPRYEFKQWSNVVCFKRDGSGVADAILNTHAQFLWQ